MTEYIVLHNNTRARVSITIPDDQRQDAVCIGFDADGTQTYNEPLRNDVARENVAWLMMRTDAYTVTVQE